MTTKRSPRGRVLPLHPRVVSINTVHVAKILDALKGLMRDFYGERISLERLVGINAEHKLAVEREKLMCEGTRDKVTLLQLDLQRQTETWRHEEEVARLRLDRQEFMQRTRQWELEHEFETKIQPPEPENECAAVVKLVE